MQTDGEDRKASPSIKSARILVVDDEGGVRRMLRSALLDEGYTVDAAADAEEAITHASDHPPAVAIVDIRLPGMDGVEICRRFAVEHDIDVILITGGGGTYSYEDAAAAGACDFLLKPIRIPELLLRVERALKERETRAERDRMVDELLHLSITDTLTGLYNSRHLFEQMRRELSRAKRYGHPVSLIVLDLDHFKHVNDRYGHQEGDRVLRRVAQAIQHCIRKSDTAYRRGGEEFTILVPETTIQEATVLAGRLLEACKCPVDGDDTAEPFHVTASLGIARWEAGEDAESLMHRADMAMYAAKRAGRDRFAVADPASAEENPAS